MDSKAVVARFEAERQALALMDHPNIAKVLDAGTTDSGRPYFAMELVKGVPITEYCDRNRLTISERLELFIQVCRAIQHAHQKGIIHRDIKPSNVLVTLHDGKPVPKVIDFGVAKAVSARLTDKTIYTEHMQIVGTLLYMSPEQAELSGLDVDTRSDVYSLGVLLYELLTGTTPFRREELDKVGFDQQRKVIREQEPQRASVRVSSLGETATIVANARSTEAKKLQELIRGDLDWVVIKGWKRIERVDTNLHRSFLRDIARYLANTPVLAHPPSLGYTTRKLVSKHRAVLATLFVVVLALAFGLGLAWQRHRVAITTLRDLEKQAIELAKLAAGVGDTEGMEAALNVIRSNPDLELDVLRIEGLLEFTLGHLESARAKFSLVLDQNSDDYFPQALLTKTAINAGDSASFASEIARLDQMHPRDDYDRLALASVEVFRDPLRAIELTEEIGNSNRWIGKLIIRADAKIHASFESGSLEFCDQGLEDMDRVELILGPSSDSMSFRLLALTHAAYVAESRSELDRSHDYSERAKRAFGLLKKAEVDDSLAHSVTWHYHQYGPDPNPRLAWDAIQKVDAGTDYAINIAVDRMLNENDPQKALDDFDQITKGIDTAYAKFGRALLLACLPDSDKEIEQLADTLAKQRSAVFRRHTMLLYSLIGKSAKAKKLANETLTDSEIAYMGWGEHEAIRAYAAPESFSGFAELADRDRLSYTHSELTRGLIAIGKEDADDTTAKQAFLAAQESQLKIYYLHMLASAFAHQLEMNADWPCGRRIATRESNLIRD